MLMLKFYISCTHFYKQHEKFYLDQVINLLYISVEFIPLNKLVWTVGCTAFVEGWVSKNFGWKVVRKLFVLYTDLIKEWGTFVITNLFGELQLE